MIDTYKIEHWKLYKNVINTLKNCTYINREWTYVSECEFYCEEENLMIDSEFCNKCKNYVNEPFLSRYNYCIKIYCQCSK